MAKCRFKPNKRVVPRSNLDFQRFRYWQKLADLRVTIGDRVNAPLSLEEKERLADHLETAEKLSFPQIRKVLGLARTALFNTDEPNLLGNTSNFRLRKALGPKFWESLSEGSPDEAVREKRPDGSKGDLILSRYLFWHTLQFYDPRLLETYALEEMGLTEQQAEAYCKVRLEADYGSLSAKALKKILPGLQKGLDYSQACLEAGYQHSLSPSKEEIERRPLSERIPDHLGEDILSPVVKKSVKETFRLINQVLKEHGKPDRIRVELARSLKKPKKVREQMRSGNKQKKELRDAYRSFLEARLGLNRLRKGDLLKFELWLELQFAETELKKIEENLDIKEFERFAKRVSPKDQEKFRLWLECGRISPYTGKVISLNKLFSPEIEIEHIVPYSRSLDDSFINKTLAERDFNMDKGEKLPVAYFAGRDKDEWRAFVKRVKAFPKAKQEKFLMKELPEDFLNSQLNNTAQVGKEVLKGIRFVCRDCRVTNGQVTSKLRKMWKMGSLLHPDQEEFKNREDHRHHALDALVIACTQEVHIQALSRDSQFEADGFQRVKSLPFPWETLRLDANEMLQGMLIAYRKEKRLLVSRKNPYRHQRSENRDRRSHIQRVPGVRGPLHEETHYGQIYDSHTERDHYVYRRKLEDLTENQVKLIVDPAIRKIIQDHVAKHGGNLKKAMKEPVFMFSKDGKKQIPIKRVRVKNPANELIQLRPNENPKLFVASGNNWCIAIYRDAEGQQQKGLTVSFFDAVQRKMRGQKIYPNSFEGLPFAFALQQKDQVLVYDESPDEINWRDPEDLFKRLYVVVKMDKNQRITLAINHLGNIDASNDTSPLVLRKSPSTLKALPVTLSPTGKIRSRHA